MYVLMEQRYLLQRLRKGPAKVGLRGFRFENARSFSQFLVSFFILSWLPCWIPYRESSAADVSFPLVEPRLPISFTAQSASRTMHGSYEVYELTGNCRAEQGSFVATGDRMQVWIDRFDASLFDENASIEKEPTTATRMMYKAILRIEGNAEARWGDEQRIRDTTWVGRLYSHRSPDITAQQSSDAIQELPLLNWEASEQVNDDSRKSKQVRPSQFLQLPTPSNGSQIPQPEEIKATVLPPSAQFQSGETGTLGQSGMPLGGIVIEGDTSPFNPTKETTALQPPSGIVPQVVPPGSPGLPRAPVIPSNIPRIGAKSFEFSGRGDIDPQLRTIPRPEKGDSIVTISRGLRLKFNGATVNTSTGPMDLGTVVIEADRALIWTTDFSRLNPSNIEGIPIEVYLEGNVVFQQGPRTIYADRMYYNVQTETGMVLGAEILTPAPQYEGIVRLKADVVEQRSRQSYLAYNAAMTSSRLGVPRYWLQADRLSLEDKRSTSNPSDAGALLRTGATNMEATARNNFVYFGGVPVLYWPVMTSNIDAPNFYLRSIKVKNDTIFGQQTFVDWDLYQLLGINGPDGTDWRLSTDYLSKRGFALGTTYNYNVPNTLLPGPATGYFDAWGLNDKGLDILGRDRINLTPETDTRGRLIYRHRQNLTPNLELWAEVGLISDRNFMEQFFEREWDQEKDYTTSLRLRRYADNRMLDIVGQPRLNKFVTETEWLPKIEHYILGQSLFDRLTWYAHSQVGYAHQRVASSPTNATELAKFQLQNWEVDAEGIRAGTRQELALPLDFGPAKVVPYLNGEVMTWGQDVTGNSLTRLTGQAGVRSSIPFWRLFPEVQSRLFNVNGIAHKVALNSEFFYADSNRNLSQLPLYDPLDDNSQEHFRRRLVFNTFGGVLPPQFDARSYAVRQGLQRYVTASSSEVVEDQMQVRLGLDQRWQTKRGLAGRERIADLVEFDVAGILFPHSGRDNFGQTVGALNYDFRYHVGDRFTILSDGYADLFDQGLKVLSGGVMMTRPGRGDWYVGLTSLKGPIDSLVANSNLSYRMNEKWIISGGSTFDLGEVGNVGQTVSLTRVGESMLLQVGLSVDTGRDNASYFFNLEPRFFPFKGIGNLGGQVIPPAGLYGIE